MKVLRGCLSRTIVIVALLGDELPLGQGTNIIELTCKYGEATESAADLRQLLSRRTAFLVLSRAGYWTKGRRPFRVSIHKISRSVGVYVFHMSSLACAVLSKSTGVRLEIQVKEIQLVPGSTMLLTCKT